jgi:hypothetical protein
MKVCKKIKDLVEQGRIILILPQIIVDEWNKNKEIKIVEFRKASIKGQIKNAKSLSPYLEEDKADAYKNILNDILNQQETIENLVLQDIATIEALFNHPSTIRLTITDKVKLQAVDFALAKKAPFKNQNSMADSLLLFSFLDYIADKNLTNCIFVSSNTHDFSSLDKKDVIHNDLKELFDANGTKYFSNIGLAINTIEDGLIADAEVNKVEQDLQYEEISRLGLYIFKPNIDMLNASESFRAAIEQLGPDLTAFEKLKPNMDMLNASESFRAAIEQLGPDLTAFVEIRRLAQIDTPQLKGMLDNEEE